MEVGSAEPLWKEGGGYYDETARELQARPFLPDFRRLRDRRVVEIFERYGDLKLGCDVIELGSGRSPWLPCLAQVGCAMVGLDIEAFAAELARANLAGAGAKGEILCRDAFNLQENADLMGKFDLAYSMGLIEHFSDPSDRLSVIREYLRPGGRVITTVPNMQSINWLLQWIASLDRLHMHVIYDSEKLARVHEAAGFETIASGYAGFFDGYLGADEESTGPIRHWIHSRLCWAVNMCSEAWVRLLPEIAAPELGWLAPHVYYVGRRS